MERERLEGHLRSISREIKEMKRTTVLLHEDQTIKDALIDAEKEDIEIQAAFESGSKYRNDDGHEVLIVHGQIFETKGGHGLPVAVLADTSLKYIKP